jgi:hypothetical protein
MKKTFLGKPVPEQKRPQAPRRAKPMWFGLLVLPAIVAGGLLSLQKSQITTDDGPRTTGGALARSIAATQATPSETRTLGDSGLPLAPAAQVVNPCEKPSGVKDPQGHDLNQVSEAFRRISDPETHKATGVSTDVILFPLIPDGIRGVNRDGVDVTAPGNEAKATEQCSRPFWNRQVFFWFIYKALAILNWFALALTILLTMYAAFLYITGFANENNVKTAKGILTSAYVGLAIVFLAKILVFGAVSAVSGQAANNVGAPIELDPSKS